MPGKIWEHLLRQDKGTLLIEATICVGIAGILGLSTTQVTVSANQAQRTSANFNIAAQAAQGTLEKAKSTPWQQLGTNPPPAGSGPNPLLQGAEPAPSGVLLSSEQTVVHNLKLTTEVAVGWDQKPVGASTYGSKVVVVKTTWYDVEGDPKTMHSSSQQVVITPGVGEAPPAGVRGAAGGASAVTPPPTTPAPVPTYTPTPVPTTTPPPAPVASPTPTPTATPTPPPVVTPIDTKYASNAWLGSPTGAETGGLPNGGRYRNYQNGQIIWQPDIGAVALRAGTGFTNRFNSEGGVTGTFGYPTTDEIVYQAGQSYQTFQNGQMYFKQSIGSVWVPNGPVRDYWIANGGAQGWPGFPVAEAVIAGGGSGKGQAFENNAAVYWSLNTGASIVNGAIRAQFNSMGYENGPLGYPIGAEYSWNGYTRHDFQNGYMLWSAAGGVQVH